MTAFLPALLLASAPDETRAVEPAPQPLFRFEGDATPLDSLRAVAGSPDGRIVALAGEPPSPESAFYAQLRDAATGVPLRMLAGHEAPVRSLSFSRRGDRLVTVTSDADGAGIIRLFDAGTGELLRSVDAGGRLVRHLPDGRLLVAGAGRVLLFEPEAMQEVGRFPVMPVIRDISGDGRRVLGLSHRGQSELEARELPTGRTLARLAGLAGEPIAALLSFDGRTAAAADARTKHVLIWEALTGEIVHRISADVVIVSLAFAPDSRHLIAGDVAGTIRVWEIATGIETARFMAHEGPVLALATVAGDQLLSGSSDRTAALWRLSPLCSTHLPAGPFSPDSRDAIWEGLASTEPTRAYRALGQIESRPQELLPELIARIERQLVPVPDADLARLLAELDHADYLIRERAQAELEKAGDRIRPHLERALADARSPEVRSRLRLLLRRGGAAPRFSAGDLLRLRRLIGEAVSLGGDESRRLLELIAREFPDAALASEARAALRRMES